MASGDQFNEAAHRAGRNYRRSDQDTVDARGGHDFRLRELRRADAHGPTFKLTLRDLGALVHLCVRPQPDATAGKEISHVVEVALERIEVEDKRRRWNLRHRNGSLEHNGVPRPAGLRA